MQKKIGRRDERIDRLKRDLSACQRKYDDLMDEYVKTHKRLQWLEIKEAKERDEYRRKRRKRELEYEMKEEIKFKVRFEEEEREKIRKELQSKKED